MVGYYKRLHSFLAALLTTGYQIGSPSPYCVNVRDPTCSYFRTAVEPAGPSTSPSLVPQSEKATASYYIQVGLEAHYAHFRSFKLRKSVIATFGGSKVELQRLSPPS